MAGVRRATQHSSGDDELRLGTEGASRWVWRGGSSVSIRTFAARRKITSIGATSPRARGPSAIPFRHAAAGRQRCTASSAWRPDDGRVKTSLEGRRTSRLGEEGRRGAFPRVFSAGRKCFGGLRFCFLHIKQIAASDVRCEDRGRIPVEKRRECNAVDEGSVPPQTCRRRCPHRLQTPSASMPRRSC